MKARPSFRTLAAGAVAITCAVAVPALATSPTKTLTFTSVQTSQHKFNSQRSIDVDKALINGKIIGYDTLILTGNRGEISLAMPQGFLYGHLTLGTTGATGKIDGGTGSFNGATGTIKAPATNGSLIVTITYRH